MLFTLAGASPKRVQDGLPVKTTLPPPPSRTQPKEKFLPPPPPLPTKNVLPVQTQRNEREEKENKPAGKPAAPPTQNQRPQRTTKPDFYKPVENLRARLAHNSEERIENKERVENKERIQNKERIENKHINEPTPDYPVPKTLGEARKAYFGMVFKGQSR